MPEITLRQLRYFAVLSNALQYRGAAGQPGISQPTLSLLPPLAAAVAPPWTWGTGRNPARSSPSGRCAPQRPALRRRQQLNDAVQCNWPFTTQMATNNVINPA